MRGSKNCRAGGASKMIDEEENGDADTGEKWGLFIWLIQSIWEQ